MKRNEFGFKEIKKTGRMTEVSFLSFTVKQMYWTKKIYIQKICFTK